jgi:hypothetical protein
VIGFGPHFLKFLPVNPMFAAMPSSDLTRSETAYATVVRDKKSQIDRLLKDSNVQIRGAC